MNAPALMVGFALIANSSAAVAGAACTPVLEAAWIRAVPPGSSALAAYATLRNPCPKAVTVVAVYAPDFSMTMLHQTSATAGVSRMRVAGNLVVPAHGVFRLAPAGMHVMLMQPHRQLKLGEGLPVFFRLEDGRRLRADFIVSKQAPR